MSVFLDFSSNRGSIIKDAIDTLLADFLPIGIGAAGKALYVDNTRTDNYIANGSQAYPFKTIMGAINQIIQNGDNNSNVYVVNIQPGTYPENVTLNNSALSQIILNGGGRLGTVSASTALPVPGVNIQPSSGNSLDCSSNNDQISILQATGINFVNPVNIVDAVSSNLGSKGIGFVDCTFQNNVTFSGAVNTIQMSIVSCAFVGNHTFTVNNFGVNWINSDMNTGTVNLTSSAGGLTIFNAISWAFNPLTINIGNNCFCVAQDMINIGRGSTAVGIVVQNGGTFIAVGCAIVCSVTIQAGGTFTNQNGYTLLGGCSINNSGTYSTSGQLRVSTIIEETTLSPTSAATAGVTGQLAWDATNLYICTVGGAAGSATWKKVLLSAD